MRPDASIADHERITCQTPSPGKQPTRIPRWKYEAVRAALLRVTPPAPDSVPFSDLPALVARELDEGVAPQLGSVTWHVVTVKLHLEVLGEIERLPGVRPQRLRRRGRPEAQQSRRVTRGKRAAQEALKGETS